MVQPDYWLLSGFQTFCVREVAAAEGLLELLCKGFVIAEFLQDGFVEEILDVFGLRIPPLTLAIKGKRNQEEKAYIHSKK